MQDASSLRLKINRDYAVIDSEKNNVLSRNKKLNTTVTVYSAGFLLGNTEFKTNKLFIKLNDGGMISINGRFFRGDIQLIKKDNAQILVVNHINLEDYIKGILYHEVSHYWPSEALKAQAIVCRTYAVYQIQESAHKDYDVTSDIYSQVYGGRTSERYRTNKAVNETEGLVLTYQGKIFPAYYHATCAGHTEDASMLWNIDTVPLKGVICNFCKDSPHFNWHSVLSDEEIMKKLLDCGYRIGEIKDIKISGRDKSGRITELKIESVDKEHKISAKDFRNIIGPNIIRSTNFNIKFIKGDMVFVGLGWGHGVGLCQWGAYFMAKQGYTYQDILKYYYAQSNVETF